MPLISPMYGAADRVNFPKPKRSKQFSPQKLKHQADMLADKARLVALVRANGFPECKANAPFSALRRYLKERGIKP